MTNYPLYQTILDRVHLSCLSVSASGWLTFIVAFGSQTISLDPVVHATQFLFAPWWIAAFLGPILYVCAGIYYLLGTEFRVAGIFRSATAFISLAYIATLAAPLFFVAALFSSALGAVDDILDLIEIPDLSDLLPDIAGFLLDVLNSVADALGDAADAVGDAIGDVFGRSVVLRDPVSDALNEILDFLVNIIRAIIYVFMAFLFDKFLTNVRAQFAGSIISITFLGLAMMTWPFTSFNRIQAKRKKEKASEKDTASLGCC